MALTSATFVRSAWKFQRFDFLFTFLKLKNIKMFIRILWSNFYYFVFINWSRCNIYLAPRYCKYQQNISSNFATLRVFGSYRVWCLFLVHKVLVKIKKVRINFINPRCQDIAKSLKIPFSYKFISLLLGNSIPNASVT